MCRELEGIQVLDLATVTPKGEPRVAPVDGLFFRGSFWFGSAENSSRVANIRSNPAISAVVTRGLETFLVIVHGHAAETDPRGPNAGGGSGSGAGGAKVVGSSGFQAGPLGGGTSVGA